MCVCAYVIHTQYHSFCVVELFQSPFKRFECDLTGGAVARCIVCAVCVGEIQLKNGTIRTDKDACIAHISQICRVEAVLHRMTQSQIKSV